MDSAINWHDPYTNTQKRVIYTQEQHHIPGVRSLAHHPTKDSIPSIKWHYHENAFEFVLSTKGILSFCTRTSSYKFSGGDVFIAFPNEVHSTHSTDDSPISPSDMYWFQLDISDPSNFLFMNEQAAQKMILNLKAIPHHVVKADAKEIQPLLIQAFDLASKGEEPEFIAACLQLFLHLLLSYSNREQFLLSPDIGRTLNYILDHISSEISLDELASIAHLSCSQYKQKFKKQLGVSPRYYINQQKIEQSKLLLLEGMSVTDVAMHLGFTTSGYFSTVFKKYTLYTPMEYIKSQTGKEISDL